MKNINLETQHKLNQLIEQLTVPAYLSTLQRKAFNSERHAQEKLKPL